MKKWDFRDIMFVCDIYVHINKEIGMFLQIKGKKKHACYKRISNGKYLCRKVEVELAC